MNKLNLFGEVGFDLTAKSVSDQISAFKDLNEDLEIQLYSPGGNFFEGLVIHDLIRAYPGKKKIKIVGVAASMATYIMLAADQIEMQKSAFLMVHLPHGGVYGNKKDIEKRLELLNTTSKAMVDSYAKKTGMSPEAIEDMLQKETWMDSTEALKMKFVDSVTEDEVKLAANISDKYLKNAPRQVVEAFGETKTQNPKKEDLMKSDLIKVLALTESETDAVVIDKVKALVSNATTLSSDIQAKSELITGLNAKIQEKEQELANIQKDLKAFKVAEILAQVLKEQNVVVSTEVKAKLESRIEAYLADNQNPTRLEDIGIYAKHFGAPVVQASTEHGGRSNFSNSQDEESKIVAKTNEILSAEPANYPGASGYVAARAKAIEILKGSK